MKKTFSKTIIFTVILFSLFFSCIPSVFALEVSDYPEILGLPKLTTNSGLPDYASYLFGLATYIAGAIAVISFTVGAIQLAMAASSPSMANDAKDRMKGSILGLILTLSAFVILQTINPTFVNPTLTALPPTDGIYYTNGSKFESAPESVADTSIIPVGYGQIYYRCSSGPALLVWLYTNKNFDYKNGAVTKRITCGNGIYISSAQSFKWSYEKTGVYYCMDGCDGDMCSGYMSGPNSETQDEIESPFKGNLKGVRIVNNPDSSTYYGVIFHKEIGSANGGECTKPIFSADNSVCKTIDVPAFSDDIFLWNKDDPNSSGDGITFYNETFGWNADIQSAEVNIYKEDIENAGDNILEDSANAMEFDYSDVESVETLYCESGYPSCSSKNEEDKESVLSGKCCPCLTFQDCPGSIRIKGDYLVGLYSYTDDKKLYCQTFVENVENLDAYEYVQPGNNIEYVNVIPTKN